MNISRFCLLLLLVATPAAHAQRNLVEDTSAPRALITLRDASRWQAGLVYTRLSRTVSLNGPEYKLRANNVDVALGFSLTRWLHLYAQGGATEARLLDVMGDNPSPGPGGLAGVRLHLWQLHPGTQVAAWRFTIPVDVQYAYRTTQDSDVLGQLTWTDMRVAIPLDYHLTFARSFRNLYMSEFHSLRAYLGPVWSRVDGDWTRNELERPFRETEAFGVVGGADLWLFERLSFGASAEWFRDTSLIVNVRYRF